MIMQNELSLVLKVFVVSAGLSFFIKYVLPSVPIPATATNALIIVFLPTVILASLLLWRFQKRQT